MEVTYTSRLSSSWCDDDRDVSIKFKLWRKLFVNNRDLEVSLNFVQNTRRSSKEKIYHICAYCRGGCSS